MPTYRRYRRRSRKGRRYRRRKFVRSVGRNKKRPPKGVGPPIRYKDLTVGVIAQLRNLVAYKAFSIGSMADYTGMMKYYNTKGISGGTTWAHYQANNDATDVTGWTKTTTTLPGTIGYNDNVWEGFKYWVKHFTQVIKLKNNEDIPVDVSVMWAQCKTASATAYDVHIDADRKDCLNFLTSDDISTDRTYTDPSGAYRQDLMWGFKSISKQSMFKKNHKVLAVQGKRLQPGDEWTIRQTLGPYWINRDTLVDKTNQNVVSMRNWTGALFIRAQGMLGLHDGTGTATADTDSVGTFVDQDYVAYTPCRLTYDRRVSWEVRYPHFNQLPRTIVFPHAGKEVVSGGTPATYPNRLNDANANTLVVAGARDATLEAPNVTS